MSSLNGGIARSAVDFFVFGDQLELGPYATSYIPTTTVAVTRVAENGSVTLASAIGPTFSIAATTQFISSAVGAVSFVGLGNSGTSEVALYRTSDTTAGYDIAASGAAPTVSAMGTAPHRSALADNAGVRTAYWDGVSVTPVPAASMAAGQTLLRIGQGPSGAGSSDSIVSLVKVDPNPAVAR
jgi:hypothetical protein